MPPLYGYEDRHKLDMPKYEQTELPPPAYSPPASGSRRQRLHALSRVAVLAVLNFFALVLLADVFDYSPEWWRRAPEPQDYQTDFRWDSIRPTPDLRWHPCFDSFLCARLALPLDYTDPSSSATTAIALIALPSPHAPTDPSFAGPLLLNPGGPGGSGIEFLLNSASILRSSLGHNHTLIGFDPRGIGLTTPATSCFPSHQDRLIWHLRAGSKIPRVPHIPDAYARSKSLGAVCDHLHTGRFVGTPNVARDMLEIVEAFWRGVGASETAVASKGLNYWGLSYGSVLGMTFAAMFPSRVSHLALDGVLDLDDYYTGGWATNLHDADAVVSSFFRFCTTSAHCPFNASTPRAVESRLTTLLAAVAANPIPATPPADAPDWVSVDDIYTLLFWAVYNPRARFPALAAALRELELRRTAALTSLLHFRVDPPSCPAKVYGPNTGAEADSAVLCTDGRGNPRSPEEFAGYVRELDRQSRWIGGNWARIQMACVGWRVREDALGLRFAPGRTPVRTRGRVLFVGNRRDPVTPLRNAVAMRERFEGARLLVVEGEGHCSLAAGSREALKSVGEFFADREWEGGVKVVPADGVSEMEAEAFGEYGWSPNVPGGLW